MNKRIRDLRAVVLAVAVLTVAQPRSVPPALAAAPESEPVADAGETATDAEEKSVVSAIVDATVLPVGRSMIRRGTVVWTDGKITAVGSEIEVPEGAKVRDGTGMYVCPGFVAVASSGIGVGRTQGNLKNSLDPFSLTLRIALANGVTTAQVIDQRFSGFFGSEGAISSGSNSAIIKLTHGDLAGMLVREPALTYFSLPSRQLVLNYYNLRDRFRRAKEYIKQRDEAKAKKAKPPRMARELAIYVRILENENPTVFSPRNNQEVRKLLSLSEEYGFDVVLSQPDDAWEIATEIVSRGIPVLVKSRGRDFDFSTGGKVLEKGDMAPVRRPAAFAKAGVTVAVLPYKRGIDLGGLAGRDLSTLAMDAAFAVRGGMSEDEALEAITLTPAKVLGIDDRVGSLEAGKDADILILSGHPLDYRSFVLEAVINGKVYYERDKSRLYRRVPLSSEK